ncbi:MAG: DUF6916 family protein [Solirubrobacteraceae bacterium]
MTRRTLLASGGAAMVALSLPAEAAAAAHRAHRRRHHRRHPSHLRRSSYRPLVGDRFRVVGSRVHLRLEAVQNLSAGPRGSEDAFALVFRAPRRAPALRGQVPELHHPRLGSFRLLLSPGMESRHGRPYAAIINRTHR